MLVSVADVFSMIFYILLIVLVITLIVLVINAIKTLDKVDKLVDDISEKSNKLNGIFSIIDSTTDAVVSFSDVIVGFLAGAVGNILNRKKGNENEEK
ncbi:MAG: hypothetical protein PUA73_03555 [Bacilli bacterium]|nr:hypothetical protein [Bacilli bacterium]